MLVELSRLCIEIDQFRDPNRIDIQRSSNANVPKRIARDFLACSVSPFKQTCTQSLKSLSCGVEPSPHHRSSPRLATTLRTPNATHVSFGVVSFLHGRTSPRSSLSFTASFSALSSLLVTTRFTPGPQQSDSFAGNQTHRPHHVTSLRVAEKKGAFFSTACRGKTTGTPSTPRHTFRCVCSACDPSSPCNQQLAFRSRFSDVGELARPRREFHHSRHRVLDTVALRREDAFDVMSFLSTEVTSLFALRETSCHQSPPRAHQLTSCPWQRRTARQPSRRHVLPPRKWLKDER